jgi:hypothetical protein
VVTGLRWASTTASTTSGVTPLSTQPTTACETQVHTFVACATFAG